MNSKDIVKIAESLRQNEKPNYSIVGGLQDGQAFFRVPNDRIIPGDDIFKMHDEQGIPLEESAMIARERKYCIDWYGFLKCAQKRRWNIDVLIRRIKTACRDAGYGYEFMSDNFEIVYKDMLNATT